MKRLFLMLALLGSFSLINAQDVKSKGNRYKVETNRFFDNIFISVGAGAQTYFGDHNKQMGVLERVTPAFNAGIGKWFTPGLGLRFMYSGYSIKGLTKSKAEGGAHQVSNKLYSGIDPKHELYEQSFKYFHFHGDLLFNVNNLFAGYNERRFWDVQPYAGLGWARVYENPKSEELSFSLGLLNSFRLGNAVALNLDARTSLVNDRFDGEIGGRLQEGLLSITLGLTYKFSKRNWDRSTSKVVYQEKIIVDEDELNKYKSLLSNSELEINKLRDSLAKGSKKEVEVVSDQRRIASPLLVTFEKGKSNLSREVRANLSMLTEIINISDPSITYIVAGYADNSTGTKEINDRLSRERADAVYNCLVNEFGISPDRLVKEYKGGSDNIFYNDPRLTRAAIIRPNL